jgi:hypothetical protein
MLPSSLYSQSDWAELFTLCAKAKKSTDIAHYREVTAWLTEFSKTHDLPPPIETHQWSDTRYIVDEALLFLDQFAENHQSSFENRKSCNT